MNADILVIDDDDELREVLREGLETEGYRVQTAKDGEEGLRLAGETHVDLVLLDLVMPGLGGMETMLLMRRHHPALKIVMMTAFSTVENAVQAMRRGAEDYLTKPFMLNDVIVTVRRIMQEARFRECKGILDMDQPFNALANAIRRQILLLLHREGKARFMTLTRKLQIDDHTKVNFHLRMLKESNLLEQDDQKQYQLTSEGRKIADCLQVVIENLTS